MKGVKAMRRNMIMLLAAALLVVTGCKKDDKTTEGEKMTFSAGFDNGSAKTEINGLDMSWNKGDAVMINGKTFTADQSGRNTTLSGERTYQEGGLYKAYFPASMYDNGTLTLPATQTYNGNNLSGVNPMYAQSENTDLTFSNLCAMVKLQLTGSKTVKEIRVSADQPLSGEFEITTGGAGYKAVMKSQTGNAGVTLNCGAGVDLSTSNVFYVALPEGDYTNLKFYVETIDDMGTSITISEAEISANKLYNIDRTPTFNKKPEVTTTICLNCAASYGGTVKVNNTQTCEYGLVYAKKSDNENPKIGGASCTKYKAFTESLTGNVVKSFAVDMNGLELEVGVEYAVRAYAVGNADGYGTVKTIIGGDFPQPMTWTNGQSPKAFTVGNGKQVYFSQGNLQATYHAGTTEGGSYYIWSFAEHQFDFVGSGNSRIRTIQNGDIVNLYGWSTAMTYYGIHAQQSSSQYEGDFVDWGTNAIYNSEVNDWRTLKATEWQALLSRKTDDDKSLYGEGKIGDCTYGLIILPDQWNWSDAEVSSFESNWKPGTSSWSNEYSYLDWKKMESAGAVFLPAAGIRQGKDVLNIGLEGRYWSSTPYYSPSAYFLYFSSNNIDSNKNMFRDNGSSVRLVRNAN